MPTTEELARSAVEAGWHEWQDRPRSASGIDAITSHVAIAIRTALPALMSPAELAKAEQLSDEGVGGTYDETIRRLLDHSAALAGLLRDACASGYAAGRASLVPLLRQIGSEDAECPICAHSMRHSHAADCELGAFLVTVADPPRI